LYVDIGNFAVKYGLRRPGEWVGTGMRQHAFAHADMAAAEPGPECQPGAIVEAIVAAAWEARLAGEPCEGVLLSCTAAGAEDFIEALGQAFKAPVRRLGQDACADIEVGYRDPAEIGPDRLANAVAARALYGTPIIIIDCGTCITSEIINEAGVLIGGNIGAGLPLIATALMNVSERLARALNTVLPDAPENLIGHSTAEATNFGVLLQLAGTADRFVLEACLALDQDEVEVVVTGGDGEACTQFMYEDGAYHPLLTLEGLRLIDGYL
jgi:type III pantothenate kinase